MGCKATGAKRGRKSDLTGEQVEFLESYGERFAENSGNSFYAEVVDGWIEKFSYAGLNPKNKNGIRISDLHLDDDLKTLPDDKREKVLGLHETAKQALHKVWLCPTGNLRQLMNGLETRKLVSSPLQPS
jgi:hypothetical protein